MTDNQRRIERKRKKRQRRLAKAQRHRAVRSQVVQQQSIEKLWPEYDLFLKDHVDSKVTDAIEIAWRRAASTCEFEGELLEDLELANRVGFHRSRFGPLGWSINLGQLLHRELVKELSPAVARRIDVEVFTKQVPDATVLLVVRALESVRPFVACSPRRPTVVIDGYEVVVAYNLRDDDHFVRRLEERTNANPHHYAGKGEIFSFLYRWQFFDVMTLPSGQTAIRLWNWCDARTFMERLWIDLISKEVKLIDYGAAQFLATPEGLAHYLVGYCPVDVRALNSGYAILNTLLLPGMDQTPEAIECTRGMTTQERFEFSRQAAKQSLRELAASRDFSVIRKYHERVPQVRFISEEVFADDYSTESILSKL